MTVSKYNPPTQSTDTFPEYKDNIDGSIRVNGEVAANFAPRESDTPAMTVTLESGKLWDSSSVLYISQNLQTTSTITAPATNPRIDRVAIDITDGSFIIITGTESASPGAPNYSVGQYPVCQISLAVSQTTILNSDIIDERPLINLDGGGGGGFRGAMVVPSADIAIPNNNPTGDNVNWDTELYDTDGIHDNAVNPHRLTVPAGVTKIRVSASVGWDNSSIVGNRDLKLQASPTIGISHNITNIYPIAGFLYHGFTGPVVDVVAGNYFWINVRQNSGGSLNLKGSATGSQSWFAMEILE